MKVWGWTSFILLLMATLHSIFQWADPNVQLSAIAPVLNIVITAYVFQKAKLEV